MPAEDPADDADIGREEGEPKFTELRLHGVPTDWFNQENPSQ
jgi:hypothetical protein